ncbi:hypothetical protein EPUS_06944 [Endocarpon pusillum Z07020]|uniref:Isotrichodermin C-15 hydroxylase n=1 Tax=Endocarpon pusillum (strain Z07020 / HMAS-L-300199) TaxID=1263415 RepID=U1FTR4_ENDPU|nr:uncharacterized protein EPUS_06944 [Endocarpon pusillum Z07020]ERF68132.1 hypothetical protein EPUS_06944 [Endocarpon pusillum Z07020]
MHDQYGPIVRVAPTQLSYITAEAWKDIYGSHAGQAQNPKDQRMLIAPHKGMPDHILRANDANHSRYRRLMAYAFSAKALEDQQSLITAYVDILIERLKENANNAQNMTAWYNWTTFDIIGDLTFGESFHGLRDQCWHPFVETITEGIEVGAAITAISYYGLGFVLQYLTPKFMLDKFERMQAYTREKVESRLQRGTERPDFMSFIMRNDKKGQQMSKDELEVNAEILVLAGSETAASLLAAATYYLCTNRQTLEKVTSEVRDAFETDQDMDMHSLAKLDYLLAVLNESLRLYPPVPSAVPRITVNGGRISGQWVAPGTIIGIFQFAAFHSPSNFHESEALVPEPGFLTHPLSSVRTTKMWLAHLEMRLILAKVLWNFDLSLEEESKHWTNQRMHIVWQKGPLMVKLTPVDRTEKVKSG